MQADRNIARHLWQMAGQHPRQPALWAPLVKNPNSFDHYQRFDYSALADLADQWVAALQSTGLKKGDRTILMVPPSPEFFGLTFAMFRLGIVPVMIDPGMGLKPLKRCIDEAKAQAFIGINKAQWARVILGWAQGLECWQVGKGLRPVGTKSLGLRPNGSEAVPATQDSDTAAILFTSGSTGAPKGVLYTHENFNAQVEALRQAYAIEPGEVDLCTFPLFALFAPALGMASVIPVMNFTKPAQISPKQIFQPVELFGVTNLFGSPALLDRLTRYTKTKDPRLRSLKRVVSAGAPMPPKILARLSPALPEGVEIFTPYGATEALPVASIGSSQILGDVAQLTKAGKGVCIGRPVDSVEVKIIPITDSAIKIWSDGLNLPVGEIGEIIVHGKQVTRSYFNRAEATELSKIQVTDGRFYHRMGDLGYFDSQGRLWFCGRKAHRLETPDQDLYTINCEGVFNDLPGIKRTALVGQGPRGAMRPVLFVEPEPQIRKSGYQLIRRQILSQATRLEHTKSIQEVRFIGAMPVDTRHNAKIFRERLKQKVDAEI